MTSIFVATVARWILTNIVFNPFIVCPLRVGSCRGSRTSRYALVSENAKAEINFKFEAPEDNRGSRLKFVNFEHAVKLNESQLRVECIT